MNGKITLTLKNETYNVLAIVPIDGKYDPSRFIAATVYLRRGNRGNTHSVLLTNYFTFFEKPLNHGTWNKQEIAEIQAQSIPFNDDIIRANAEVQQPAAALFDETLCHNLDNDTSLTQHEYLALKQPSELEALRAENAQLKTDLAVAHNLILKAAETISELQTANVVLTADNRQLREVLKPFADLMKKYDTAFNLDYGQGWEQWVKDNTTRKERFTAYENAEKVFNGEVKS